MTTKKAPVFLNLLQIRMPVTAITSVLHRVSGVILILSLPFVIYLLGLSLQDANGFARVQEILGNGLVKLCLLAIIWSLVHHFLAGIRFLLTDLDLGLEKGIARKTAWLVNICAFGLLFVMASMVICL
jgi:succinate dehydrogenase / fumarate reductase cytochrome b subunit